MKRTVPAILVTLIFALTLTACDDFFSSSWGSPREYRAENINVTVNNLDRWLERTVGNPPLARLVSENISRQVQDPHHPHRGRFQSAGVRIALESSGLGVALLGNAMNILSNMADTDDEMDDMLKDVLSGIQGDFRRTDGVGAANTITEIVINDINPGNVPIFRDNSFAHNPNYATPSDVGQVVLVLTLAVLEERGKDIDDWDDFDLEKIGLHEVPNEEKVGVEPGASNTLRALAAYLNLIAGDSRFDDNFLTSAIREAFIGSND